MYSVEFSSNIGQIQVLMFCRLNLFDYAQKEKFAIPAINVTSSSTVVAALEAARDKKSPIILQTSQGGAAYFAGKVSSKKINIDTDSDT